MEMNLDGWARQARDMGLRTVVSPDRCEALIFNMNALERGFLWVKPSGLAACEPVDAPVQDMDISAALALLDRLAKVEPIE